MSKIYVVNVNIHASSVAKYHVVSGGPKGLTIRVEKGSQVELVDSLTGLGPKKIQLKRSGSDLFIAFEEGSLLNPDLIVENYFDDKDGSVVGKTDAGQLIDYVPVENDKALLIGNLSDGLGGVYELGHGIGTAAVAETGYGKLLAGVLGLGLMGGGGGGSGGGGKSPAADSSAPATPADSDTQAPVAPTVVASDTDNNGRINASGTAEPGSKVTVTWPNGSTSTVVVDVNGNWSVESSTTQPSGTVSVVARDASGNTSLPATAVYTDTQRPAAPTVVVNDADNDGRINASGTAEPGSTVTVTWPDLTISTVTVAADGSWSVESPTVQGNGTGISTDSGTVTDGRT